MGLFDSLFGGLFGGGNNPGSGFGNGFIGGATGGAPNPFGGSPFGGGLFSPPMPWGPQPTPPGLPPGFPPNPFGGWPFQQPPQSKPQPQPPLSAPLPDPWIGPGPTPINPPQAQSRLFAPSGQMPFNPNQAMNSGPQMGPGHPPWLGRWSVPGTQMEGVAPQQNPMGATRMSGGVGTGPFGQRQQQNNGGGMGWQNIPLPAANVPQPPPNPWSTRRG